LLPVRIVDRPAHAIKMRASALRSALSRDVGLFRQINSTSAPSSWNASPTQPGSASKRLATKTTRIPTSAGVKRGNTKHGKGYRNEPKIVSVVVDL
jgi:hypothetical protein